MPKWGVAKKIWRHGAVADLDRYAHQKFQIDTTSIGDAIRVRRILETPTYKVKKLHHLNRPLTFLHTALIKKNFKP